MLLEFTVRRAAGEAPAYALISQITDLSPAQDSDDVRVGLRSGQAIYVKESMADILDALSYATRHISTTPGIVDKIDGEREEIYPWRRREKVTELAAKWRNYVETMKRGSENEAKPAPKYTPTKLPPNPIPPWLDVPPIIAPDVPPVRRLTREQARLLSGDKTRGDLVNEVWVPSAAIEAALAQPLLNPPPPTAAEDAKFNAAVDAALSARPGRERLGDPSEVAREVTPEEAKAAYAAGKPVTIVYDGDDARPVTERQMEAPPAVGDWRDAEREAEQVEIDKMNAHSPTSTGE